MLSYEDWDWELNLVAMITATASKTHTVVDVLGGVPVEFLLFSGNMSSSNCIPGTSLNVRKAENVKVPQLKYSLVC